MAVVTTTGKQQVTKRAGRPRKNISVGGYFSGTGTLERCIANQTGGGVVLSVESNAFCRRLLLKNKQPHLLFVDVASVPSIGLDILTAGFPCQDLSSANASGRLGLLGQKSSLVKFVYAGIYRHSPDWVVIENVGKMWRSWVPSVRRQLWARGYPSVSIRLCASWFGAPHNRDRCFIVAFSNRGGKPAFAVNAQASRLCEIAKPFVKDWGEPPPGALGMDDGNQTRDRLRALGNAVMPCMANTVGAFIAECISLESLIRDPIQ